MSRKSKVISFLVLLVVIAAVAGYYAYRQYAIYKEETTPVVINGVQYANKFGKELFSAELIGRNKDGKLNLMWILHGWDYSTRGYVIKRKSEDKGTWEALGHEPVCPGISANRNWKAMGLNDEQVSAYSKKFEECVKSGKVKTVGQDEFLAFIRKYGIRSGDRIAITENLDLPFFMGIAFMDNSPVANAEYGLFPVDKYGRMPDAPIATHKNKTYTEGELAVKDLKVRPTPNGVNLTWGMPAELYRTLGLIRFNVYKRTSQAPEWKFIAPAFAQQGNTYAVFNFFDNGNKGAETCEYAISARNYFQDSYPKQTISYDAETMGPLKDIKTEKPVVSNQDVTVKLIIPKSELKKLKACYVQRSTNGRDYKNLGGSINPDETIEYTDRTEKAYGETLYYRFAFLRMHNSMEYTTDESVMSPAPRPGLPAPANFNYKFIEENGKRYVLFTWDKVEGAQFYRFLEKGPLDKKLAEFLPVKDGSTQLKYEYPSTMNTETYSFGMAAVSSYNETGTPAVIENVVLPGSRLNWVSNFKFEHNGDTVELTWTPHKDSSVTGYRLYENGKLIADEKVLTRDVSTYTVKDFGYVTGTDGYSSCEFTIRPVNFWGEHDKSQTSFRFKPLTPEEKAMDAPENFKGEFFRKDGKRFIRYTWDAPKNKDAVNSCEMMVSWKNDGRPYAEFAISSYPNYEKTEFVYAIPDTVTAGTEITATLKFAKLIPNKTFNGKYAKCKVNAE